MDHITGDVMEPVLCGGRFIPVFHLPVELLQPFLCIGAGAKASMEVLVHDVANAVPRYSQLEAVEGINADCRQLHTRDIEDAVVS